MRAFRSQQLKVYEMVMSAVADAKKNNVDGQLGLFDLVETQTVTPVSVPLPDIPELSAREKMQLEKETTGLYLSGHPMDEYRQSVKKAGAVPIGEILESFSGEEPGRYQDGQLVAVAGIVTKLKSKTTKNGSLMAYVTLEDDTGAMEMLCFSRVLAQYGGCLQENFAVLAKGRISARDEKEPQLMTDSAIPLEDAALGLSPEAQPVKEQKPRQSEYRKPVPVPGTARADAVFKAGQYGGAAASESSNPFSICSRDVPEPSCFSRIRKKRMGTTCLVDEMLLDELRELLGRDCVVLK